MSEHILEFFPAGNGESQRLTLNNNHSLQINSAFLPADPADLQIFTGLTAEQLGTAVEKSFSAAQIWVPGAILQAADTPARQALQQEVLKRLAAGKGIALFGDPAQLSALAEAAGLSTTVPTLNSNEPLPLPAGMEDLTLHAFCPADSAPDALLLHIRINAKRRTSQCLFNGPLRSDQIDRIWEEQTALHTLSWDIYTIASACRYQALNQHERVPEVVKQTNPSDGAREILRRGERSALMVASCEPMDDLVSGAEAAPHREAANFYKSWVRKVYNGKLLCTTEVGKPIKIGFSEFGWREIRDTEGFGI